MPYECWESFAKFAHSSIKRYYSSGDVTFEIFCEKLTNLVSEVIGEKRRTLLDADITHEGKVMYLESMISKINILLSNLFEDSSNGLRYLPDMVIITDDDNIEINSAKILKKNIINLGIEFDKEHKKHLFQRPILQPLAKKSRKRIPSRESFEILEGKEVNLRAVHRHLTNEEYPFIDPHTTFDEFAIAFSGAPVTNKISWLYANALHYFIDSIHGIGVKRANEGQWARASKCFTVNGKSLTPDQIKDAGDPASSVTSILDNAIRSFF